MNQTVLVNTKVDKRSEVGNVGNRPLQFHSVLQVADLLDVLSELRYDKLLARITARSQQFLAYITDRVSSVLGFKRFEIDRLDLRWVFNQLVYGYAQ